MLCKCGLCRHHVVSDCPSCPWILSNWTSVSKTIRKPPLAEAKTALEKQENTFCGTRVLFCCRTAMKNCFRVQNFTEIGQSAAELWQKNDFKNDDRPPFQFFFKHLVIWLSPSSKFAVIYQLNFTDRMMFRRGMAIWWFSRWRISAILNFRGPIMGSLKSPRWTTRTSYRSSIETAQFFKKIEFFCIRLLATVRQTNDEQMDNPNA